MKIPVTQPWMPSLEEFIPYLQRIWDKEILTNGGPLHQELEIALSDYPGVPHVSLVSNGTLGLLISIKALEIECGEVITTEVDQFCETG